MNRPIAGAIAAAGWAAILAAAGCATGSRGESADVSAKLARLGLVLVSESEAGIPPAELGRYLPCRVIPGFQGAVLPEHPAGYLLAAIAPVDHEAADPEGARSLLRELEQWDSDRPLKVTARRNTYLQGTPDWWEAEVVLRLR